MLENQHLCKACIDSCPSYEFDLPVLVSGESGTGKSLVAKLFIVFYRRNLPFVSIPSDLIELMA